MDYYPIIAEFTYVKMVATLLLSGMNEINLISDKPMVAQGPVENEMMNIEYARRVFELKGGSYRAFCKAHMSVKICKTIFEQLHGTCIAALTVVSVLNATRSQQQVGQT